jgi:PHP family Zn ribbon phosphoesterase
MGASGHRSGSRTAWKRAWCHRCASKQSVPAQHGVAWRCNACVRCVQAKAVSEASDATALMRAGHLLVVRSLLRVLPMATHAKAALDACIDAAAAMQNLRSVIVKYRANMLKEPREDKRAQILAVCAVRRTVMHALHAY